MLFVLGSPSPLTVGIVMAFGVILAGLPKIGSGRDWIPTAALLVLLVGGHNPDQFSFGYLLQMGVGVTVGILVNLLVFPPLHFRAAELSIAELRLALAQQLWDMAKALEGELAAGARGLVHAVRARSQAPPAPSAWPWRRRTPAGGPTPAAGSIRGTSSWTTATCGTWSG